MSENQGSVNVENLLSVLKMVKPGLAKKDFVESTTHYFFTGEHLLTYNDKVCVSIPFTDFPGPFSVKANDFYNIISGLKEDELKFKLDDASLMIKTKSTKAKIKVNREDFMLKTMFESLDIENQTKIELNNAKEMKKGLELCKFSASQNAHNITLYCVYISPNMICSSDSYRVSKYKIKENFNPVLIPVSVIKELVAFDFNAIAQDDNWVHFYCEEGLVFSTRLIDKDYPDLSKVFSAQEKVASIDFPNDFKEIVDYLKVMTDDEENFIHVTIKDNKLTCKAEKSLGWLQRSSDVKYEGVEISFTVNPTFLKEIINLTDSMEVRESSVYVSSDSFEHVMTFYSEGE